MKKGKRNGKTSKKEKEKRKRAKKITENIQNKKLVYLSLNFDL